LTALRPRDLTFAGLFAALIAAGAYISVPVGAVPFTLQVLFVLLAGLVLGARLGVLSVCAYLALGLVAPVYAGGTSGVGVLFGPTGGYLWGFVLGALVSGLLVSPRPDSVWRLITAALAALIPIYCLGALWLAWQLQLPNPGAVVSIGIAPFLPADVGKAVAAGVLARSLVSLPLGLPVLQRSR
jgi:biotin transport system substrate-specific component